MQLECITRVYIYNNKQPGIRLNSALLQILTCGPIPQAETTARAKFIAASALALLFSAAANFPSERN